MDIDLYPILEAIHILSAMILVGAGIGGALHLQAAHRSGKVAAIAVAAGAAVNIDRKLTMPAAVIQPLTGIGIIVYVGFPHNSPWLVASYVLYGLALIAWFPALKAQRRMRDLAEAALAAKKPLGADYSKAFSGWRRFDGLTFFLLMAVFYLMVMKPDLWLYW